MLHVLAAPRSPPHDVPIDVSEDEGDHGVSSASRIVAQEGDEGIACPSEPGQVRQYSSGANIAGESVDETLAQVTQLRSPLSELMWAVSLLHRPVLEREAIKNNRQRRLQSLPSSAFAKDHADAATTLPRAVASDKTQSYAGRSAKALQSSMQPSPQPSPGASPCSTHTACSPYVSRRRPARSHRMDIRRKKNKDIAEASPVISDGQVGEQHLSGVAMTRHGSPDGKTSHVKPKTLFVQRRRAATSPARTTHIERSSSGLFIPHSHQSPRERGMARSQTQAAIVKSYGCVERGTRLQRRRPASLNLDVDVPDPSLTVRQLISGKSSSTSGGKEGKTAGGTCMPHETASKTVTSHAQRSAASSSPATLLSASTHMPSPETTTSSSSSSMLAMSAPRRAKTAPFTATPLAAMSKNQTSTLRGSGKKSAKSCDDRCPHRLKGSLLSAGTPRRSSASPYSCSCLFPTPLTAPRTWSEDVLSSVLGYDFDERDNDASLCKLY